MSTTSTTFLPWHRALIEEEEIKAVVEVLQSGWLTTGPRVREFEAAFAKFTGAGHAVAVSSCTAALHLALSAIDLEEGDEVIVPTMTFAASGEVVLYFKGRPVLVDCGRNSFHMDPDQVEAAVTSRTRAIMPVHYAGFPCDMDPILEVAKRHNLKVIEDAAHSFPASYKGRMVGTIGDITCFSFYATKTMTTGEGGMITTENPEYADRMRILSLHGISRDSWKRYMAGGKWRYEILETGYKYNLTDLQAAIGLVQLAKSEAMRSRREALARRYTALLGSQDSFLLPSAPPEVEHAWHLYVIQLNPEVQCIDRDQVVEELQKRGIGTSVHFIPLHTHPLYREKCGYRYGQFPNAEKRFAGSISLPLYPGLSFEEQDRVVEALSEIASECRR